MLARHLNLLWVAAENVAARPATYAFAVSGLVAGLTLLLAGIAVSEGTRAEALDAVDAGADLYCTWDTFGRDTPLPRERVETLRGLPGVQAAVPRIIGRVRWGDSWPVVVGVPLARLASADPAVVDGALPSKPADVLVGHELARERDLAIGSTVLLEGSTSRLFRVSGIGRPSGALGSAKSITCALEEAAIVFGVTDHVSDVCLYTRPGYADRVAEAVVARHPRYRVQTRAIVRSYVTQGMTIRAGLFTVLFALTLALAVPAFASLTYFGHTPRRREIGLLKAEGWRTADVLEMVALENVIVSVGAAASALLLAWIWVRVLRAPLIAPFFFTDLGVFPEMRIPSRFVPLPALLAIAFCLAVTMSGSIYTTWRTSITPAAETLR